MNRFNLPHSSPLDPISFNRGPAQQHSSKTAVTPSSSIIDDVHFVNSRHHSDPCSTTDNWTNSSSSSPEAMMSCQQPWTMGPAPNYTLIPSHPPMEHEPDELPRIMASLDTRSSDWSAASLVSSSYSSSRQLKPELRRLPDFKGSSDWVQAPRFKSDSFYKSSQSVGSHPPHSGSSSAPNGPATSLLPPSPTLVVDSSYHSLSMSKLNSPVKVEMDREDMGANMDEGEDSNADPPYSQLIYEALRSAPGMRLPLQGIYGWFEQNTAKGKDRNSKGWQNSIRHNLSMNAGFEAVREESTPGKKAVNFWRLTDEAVNNGIQSTTRYRKQANYKKSLASDPPAPQRQRSGAKGGKATKITARFRGSASMMSQDELRRERCRQRIIPSQQRQFQKNIYGQYLQSSTGTTTPTTVIMPSSSSPSASNSIIYVPGGGGGGGGPTAVPMTRSSAEPFDLGNVVVGCADLPPPPCAPIFCDMAGPEADCPAFDAGFMGWDGIQSFPNGLLTTTGPEILTDLQLGL